MVGLSPKGCLDARTTVHVTVSEGGGVVHDAAEGAGGSHFIGLSVFCSRNQAKDHGLRTILRTRPNLSYPPPPGEHCWGGQIRLDPVSRTVRGKIR